MLSGTYAMAGNINLNNHILYSPKDPTQVIWETDNDAAILN